jgi:hypothetical protein
MAIRYGSRAYRAGDEIAINELYWRITGRARTIDQFRWQWLHAPGGQGEMWLIEATHDDGRVELIGHHGIMPVRFTWADRDLLFGKTENTMVLPEYRRKILYPRFEKTFAEKYEGRFDALFSTTGPKAAIRQRAALGYAADEKWINFERANGLLGPLAQLATRIPALSPGLRWMARLRPLTRSHSSTKLSLLSAAEAAAAPFFRDYWGKARLDAGIAPRRDAEDLNWRYWSNPYGRHVAVVMEAPGGEQGYAVVEVSTPAVARIVDFSFAHADEQLLSTVLADLNGLLKKKFGAKMISYATTTDGQSAGTASVFRKFFSPSVFERVKSRNRQPSFMPRKVTARGLDAGLSGHEWGITPIVFEGRT